MENVVRLAKKVKLRVVEIEYARVPRKVTLTAPGVPKLRSVKIPPVPMPCLEKSGSVEVVSRSHEAIT